MIDQRAAEEEILLRQQVIDWDTFNSYALFIFIYIMKFKFHIIRDEIYYISTWFYYEICKYFYFNDI